MTLAPEVDRGVLAAVRATRRRRRIDTVATAASAGWLILLAVLTLVSIATPLLDPYYQDFLGAKLEPSLAHPFGTDGNGRDVFARTVAGAQNSLVVAVITLGVGAVGGTLIGVAAGYFRGALDNVIGFLIDAVLAIPALLLIITIVSFRGPSITSIGTTIGLLMIPAFARVTRSIALTVRERDYVKAAVLIDTPTPRILVRAVLPAVAPALVSYAFTAMTAAIVAEGSLSFLGYGLAAPAPSWGGIIAEGRSDLATAPWITLAPALALAATVMAITTIGERAKERYS
ncbi:ABC transporter permease [Demequina subtropica]|uniref:ABC transporter permease n=1 Tax=Demequina subtropica TaxID=1638989 RepID=UPI000784A953|nr:ABC transporter permease [Demequina subtropica]